MAVCVLSDRDHVMAALYCTTSDWAFGPVFTDSDDRDADERAEAFLRWLNTCAEWTELERYEMAGNRRDVRELTDAGLERAYGLWLAQEARQWLREEAAEVNAE